MRDLEEERADEVRFQEELKTDYGKAALDAWVHSMVQGAKSEGVVVLPLCDYVIAMKRRWRT